MNILEQQFENYLKRLGLNPQYEELRGTKRPDFSVYNDPFNQRLIAVIEIEEISMPIEEQRALRQGQSPAFSRDPYQSIRNKIGVARKQFKGSENYSCILIIKSFISDPKNDSWITLAAMLGDMTVTFSIPQAQENSAEKPSYGLGARGKMLNPHTLISRNTAISAIGIVNTIRPDAISSGYEEEIAALVKELDTDDENSRSTFFKKAAELEEKYKAKGYDITKEDMSVIYVKNPYAKIPFPEELFQGPYDKHFEYDLTTSEFRKIYDGLE